MSVKLAETQTPSKSRYPGLIQAGECLGEIRVDVTLVNTFDEALLRRGQIRADEVRQCQVTALVDTGAVRACVPADIVKQLGLATTGRRLATYADGRSEAVDVTEPVRFVIMDRDTVESALVLGDEVLIGQLTLEGTDLWADCKGQRLVPNPAHPDEPAFRV
jgi:clan AA aspartic protease